MKAAVRRQSLGLLAGALALTAASGGTACNRHPSAPTLTLVWQDEFDGPSGQSPDPSRWTFDVGTGWGNSQLEYDTARPENAALDGAGHLAITARQENYSGQPYTSARLNTNGRFQQAGGRFEARMRMPSGRGLWPAFWLLGSNFSSVGWPACGEIDVVEYRGQEPALVHGSVHGPGYSGGSALTQVIAVPGAPLDSAFHVYAVDWTAGKIVWSVDGNDYFTVTTADLPRGGTWVFDHPFFIILDLAVGGTFVGSPDSTTAFPQQLLVDYVRVYKEGS